MVDSLALDSDVEQDRLKTQLIINTANVIDYADAQIVPAVYRNLEQEFSLSLEQLGLVTTIRSILQAFSTPFWGWISDKYSRKKVLSFGCFFWGIMTLLVGSAVNYHQILIYRAINGIGLAIIAPTTQSIIADYFPPEKRGKAFGWLGLTSVLGAILGTLYATSISGAILFGVPGWRFAFYSFGVLSILLGIIVLFLAKDPVRGGFDTSEVGVGFGETEYKISKEHLKTMVTNKTILLIIFQGVIGSIPWTALAFMILWFQYIGFSDFMAAMAFAIIAIGAALGNLFGGWIGDKASKWNPDHGRLIVAQISIFSGIPLTLILFLLVPRQTSSLGIYLSLGIFTGFMISWVAPASNNPIFGEVIEPEARSSVYAFDRLFEGSVSATGTFLVAWLAQTYFGYIPRTEAISSLSPEIKATNINALANGLAVVAVVSWTLCFIIYMFIHFTYPKDRDRVRAILKQRVIKYKQQKENMMNENKNDTKMKNKTNEEDSFP